MDSLPLAVLLVVCFYLLVHWEKVKRPICLLVGAAGIALVLAGAGSRNKVVVVLTWLGMLAAFVGLFVAVYPGVLLWMAAPDEQPSAAPPQAEA